MSLLDGLRDAFGSPARLARARFYAELFAAVGIGLVLQMAWLLYLHSLFGPVPIVIACAWYGGGVVVQLLRGHGVGRSLAWPLECMAIVVALILTFTR